MTSEAAKPFLSSQEQWAANDHDDEDYASQRLGSSSNNTAATDPPPTDVAWAVAFKISVAITVLSALFFGMRGFEALNNGEFFKGGDGRRLSTTSIGGYSGAAILPALFFVGVVGIGWAFALVVLHLVIKFSKAILQVAFLGSAGVAGMAAVSALAAGHWFACTVPAVMCAWCLRVFFKRQSQIRFSSANLKVAALAVRSMPWTFRAALLMSGVQVVWVLVCGLAAGGSIASARTVTGPDGTVYPSYMCRDVRVSGSPSCMCKGQTILYSSTCDFEGNDFLLTCFWLATFAWGAAVFQNVLTATVTGSVASWWFSPGDVSPVRGALYRATHGSFGSLCKAAAVTTIMRCFVLAMRRLPRVCRCFTVLLEWLRGVMDYVLSYAICFISIYGLSYSEAGRRVSELFRKRGVTTVANDIIVDAGLSVLVVAVTVCYVAVASFLLQAVIKILGSSLVGGVFVMGFFVTAFVSYFLVVIVVGTTVDVLRSAFKAVFVCFVQDPEALAANHDRQIYDELSLAWRDMQVGCPGMKVVLDDNDKHGGIQQA